MGIYFGTDGIRGKYGEKITPEIAFKVGNSIACQCRINKKIVVGRDTRKSGSLITLSLASGIMTQGVDVIDVGVVPTPIVAFLAKEMDFDYGIVITASHNEPNYNGIKVFNSAGFKLNANEEKLIEKGFLYQKNVEFDKIGRYIYRPRLVKKYKNKILSSFSELTGLKVVLDLANGASYRIAKELFVKQGASVVALNRKNGGLDINENCGALHPEALVETVKSTGADMGFSFDGDADRIIACNEKGEILDGDDILFMLAKQNKHEKYLVGTSMTNSALEKELDKKGLTLLRSDVGDKNVVELMQEKGAILGGETCGHIINMNYSTTGDGVLTALAIAEIVKKENKPLSKICTLKHFPQVLINVEATDKNNILASSILQSEIIRIKNEFGKEGRIVVRASGTENKIRIMSEHKSHQIAEKEARNLENIIKTIENKDI